MTAGLRLAAFAALAGIALVAAWLLGTLTQSDRPAARSPAPATTEHGHDAGTTSAAPTTGSASAAPAGLAVAADGYRLVPQTTRLAVGATAAYRFAILDPEGDRLRAYVPEQTKLLHLIVVRRDLTGFQHLHPTLGADGTWSTPLRLPEAGVYHVFADFRPRALDRQLTLGADLFAGPGVFTPLPLPEPDEVTNTADGHAVSLRRAGDRLTFRISKDDRAVTDLQPYLGANGHLVALRAGDLAYTHVHPAGGGSGPELAFRAAFPGPGFYRLFLQFQRGGTLHLATMTIEVSA